MSEKSALRQARDFFAREGKGRISDTLRMVGGRSLHCIGVGGHPARLAMASKRGRHTV